MPKYRVTKPYNHEVKVGDYITTDNLHPALLAHVVLADDRSLEVATPSKPEETEAQRKKRIAKEEKELKEQEAEKAKQIQKSEAPAGEKPTDPAPTIVPDEDGPGENS